MIKIKKISVRRQDSEMASNIMINTSNDDKTGYDVINQDEENKAEVVQDPVHAMGDDSHHDALNDSGAHAASPPIGSR